jgi:hypothetical protein
MYVDHAPIKPQKFRFLEFPNDRKQRVSLPDESRFYRLVYIRKQSNMPIPALLNFHPVGQDDIGHVAMIDEEIANRIRYSKQVLVYLSVALSESFWTLLHWNHRLMPHETKVIILRDPEDPEWNQLAVKVLVPRHEVQDWLKLWKDLEKQIYQRIPSKQLAVFVERY